MFSNINHDTNEVVRMGRTEKMFDKASLYISRGAPWKVSIG